MAAIRYAVLPAIALTLVSIGCSTQEPAPVANEPSYADLVVTYNAELTALDRLEALRKEKITEYEQRNMPKPEDAVRAITDALNSATKGGESAEGVPVDPQAMLDQAVQNAEKAQQVTSQLLQAVAQPKPGEGGEPGKVEYSPEFQQQLAELDREIAQQRERVERARQARDVAEAKQKK